MANPWPTPSHRRDNISSTSDGPSLVASQWQSATRTDSNSSFHGCPCSLCSVPAARHNDQQSANWTTGAPDVLYANRSIGFDNHTGIADVNGPTQVEQFVAPPALGNVVPRQATGPFQAQTNARIDQILIPDMSATESLRRLAGRYVNDPESLINAVRFEQASSGRFLVVITLETAYSL